MITAVARRAGAPTDQLQGRRSTACSRPWTTPRSRARTGSTIGGVAVRKIANEIFDFGEIAKRSLARHWQPLSEPSATSSCGLFADLLERSYISKIETVRRREDPVHWASASTATTPPCPTKIITKNGTEVPVDYRMHKQGDRWLVYDVSIEGVSLVSNYRTQFNKIIQTSSYNELVSEDEEQAGRAPRGGQQGGEEEAMTKSGLLRAILRRPGLVPMVGAHDALSAKLIEAAGFPLVWSSSFAVSAAQRAVPDVNLLTMTENLEAALFIDEAVAVPVIADVDNGYGNVVNVVRTVREYERAGIAGICMEDNVFPKKCSLYPGMKRELPSVEEFAGKVRASVDTRQDPDFVVIARVEALIAGWGMKEALRRAHAYADAGADMVLMHSKSKTAAEILEFMRLWDRPTPVVVVPTLYPSVTFEELEQAGVKMVIWANHVLRGAVQGRRST